MNLAVTLARRARDRRHAQLHDEDQRRASSSMALAWIIGVYLAGRPFNEVAAGFPTALFLTLVGVTLLFTQAKVNGTLDKIAHRAVRSCRGSLPLIPIMFFFLAFVFGSIGPGSVASAALIGPMAMAVAAQIGVPAFLMAIMVANGAGSASLSPIGPTGHHRQHHLRKDGHAGGAVAELRHRLRRPCHRRVRRLLRASADGRFFRAAERRRVVDGRSSRGGAPRGQGSERRCPRCRRGRSSGSTG